jgi:DNA ligase 1
MGTSARLTIRSVFSTLREIAEMSGAASQTKKAERIKGMLVACRDTEALYITR